MSGLLLQITDAVSVQDTLQDLSAGVQEYETLSLWSLMLQGGWVMLPLIVLSIVAIYIFIERFLAINRASKEETNFMNNIRDFIHDGRLDSALSLCKHNNSPIARMIEKGLKRIGKPLGDVSTAIENVGKLEVNKLEKNVAFIGTVAGVAPMIGFMGTVSGMIKAFYNMAQAGNNIDISLLSGGIYQAMVTTLAGLIVGIVAFICYNILVTRIEKVVFMLEARATEFMDLLNEPAS